MHQLQISVSTLFVCIHGIMIVEFHSYSALIRLVSAVPLNSTSVNVSWTPLNLTAVMYYNVTYTIVNGSGEGGSGAVHFPATVSSGVVSGLQEGQWYQFSISVTLNVSGQSFSGIPVSSQPISECHFSYSKNTIGI